MKVMIVGAGKLGYKLANAISGKDILITIMESDSEVLEKITDHVDALVIKASGIQVDALKEAEINTYDLIIAVTDSDETNIVVCTLAKKLGCKKAIARIRNPEYANHREFIKSAMDIDYIINPELAIVKVIIRYLLKSYSFYSEDFAEGRITMADFSASSLPGFPGKQIRELENMEGLLIAAISRNGEIIIPHGSTYIYDNDIIYIIGKRDNVDIMATGSKSMLHAKNVKKVMVLGGGKIGYYLGEKLAAQGIIVKIIEQDRDRCQYLSEKLNNVLVICGDGTDADLLTDEDMSSMDAFIGVTGYDEENLLMTLMAKQAGVKKVIAKVSKPSFVQLTEKLGVDIALSPIDITVGEILKFIRGGKVMSVSLLLGGQAEVTEILADTEMPVVGKTIAQLGLPKGIIIGAIILKNVEALPLGILFWRSFTHWIGGMGILVFTVAVLPALGIGSFQLFKAESPGPIADRLVPRIKDTAKVLYVTYIIMTLLEVILLVIGRMPLYDALVHTFGTVGTGGLSIKNASIGAYNNTYINLVIAVFMVLASTSFSLYYALYRGKWKEVLKDQELRFFLGVISASVILIGINISGKMFPNIWKSLEHSFFQVSSIISTTGYSSTNFDQWPSFSKAILFILMFIGGCAGSTGGGMKAVRVVVILKLIKREIQKAIHPRAVIPLKLGDRTLSTDIIHSISSFTFLYILIFVGGTLALTLEGISLTSASSAAVATLSNIGPGFEIVGPVQNYSQFSTLSKLLMSGLMLIGRLELFTIIVLFNKKLWTDEV